MTKYWIGPAVFVHLLATIAVLFWADAQTRMAFREYLWHLAPLVVADTAIHAYALSRYRHAEVPRTSLLGAVVLVYASWPDLSVGLEPGGFASAGAVPADPEGR